MYIHYKASLGNEVTRMKEYQITRGTWARRMSDKIRYNPLFDYYYHI